DSVTGVAILGCTGSIGTQSLDVLSALRDRFRVVGLAAGRNLSLFQRQIDAWQPALVACEREADRVAVRSGTAHWATLEEIATHPEVAIVIVATIGKIGLAPALAALRAGKAVALANKEALIMAGGLLREAAAAGGGELRPVDSEHSAIWQCLWGERPEDVRRLILTASGGAFRDRPLDELRTVTPEQALRHPTWQMGRKITVDCATLFNKGLEAIEAHILFDVPLDRVAIVMHRESIVHSLVEFTDGALKAQLGLPDMRLPIQLALTYPERLPVHGAAPLDLAAAGALHFEPLDMERLPCLRLALDAGARGGAYPAVLAAADEIAVASFLDGQIRFTEIAGVIEATLGAFSARSTGADTADLDTILAADGWARAHASRQIGALAELAESRSLAL
ncbi:MAG TPA: 1-deoxy-D-xylulose-5-phosphate reductoisomerase, partial [Dehalococcoidia bacterium]|nr:1-deoxy-D-xylulose-5-phosphate reductoisomerase [Dehalococcoidia bacterium]